MHNRKGVIYKSVLFIGLIWPEPKSSAAGKRILQLMDLFLEENYVVSFASPAQKSEFSELNSEVSSYFIELNSSSFDDFITKLNPDIVVFDRFLAEEKFSWRVKENCPNAFLILDTEDLHFLRNARQNAFKNKQKFEENDLCNSYTERELASVLRSDLSIVISDFEMNLLTEKFNISKEILFYLPFLVDNFDKSNRKYSERKDFAFIGNFFHEPNVDAVNHLKKNIWPLIIKKDKSLKLNIYGAYMPQKILDLHNENQGFLIKGRVEDAKEVFENSRVFLAPLRFGAGQKGKLLETLIYGLPSVVSEIAVESMIGDLDWSGFVEDDDIKFAKFAIDLYHDEILWEKFSMQGNRILKNRFAKAKFKDLFFEKIINIQAHLIEHRNSNFVGRILSSNTLNATKYFSKWIEEKNKIK
jgi:O-antigen biosynthesis protein